MSQRTWLITAVVCAVALSGCDAGSSTAEPVTPTSPSSTASVSPSGAQTSPSSTPPEWQSQFTSPELAAYDQALASWNAYQVDSEPIWASGQATPAARAVFEKYWVPWQQLNDLLVRYEASAIRIEGIGIVLSSRATRISLSADGGGSVTFRQCVDGSNVKTYQSEELLTGGTTSPQLVTVEMAGYAKSGAVKWLVLTESNPKGAKPC